MPSSAPARTRSSGRARGQLTSPAAAAERYDVNERTVRRWITDGLITGYRVGAKLVKVDLAEIEAKVIRRIPAAGGGDAA